MSIAEIQTFIQTYHLSSRKPEDMSILDFSPSRLHPVVYLEHAEALSTYWSCPCNERIIAEPETTVVYPSSIIMEGG
jgi:hypothetical protein